METEKPLQFKQLLPVLFIIFVDTMGITIIIPILPFYALSYDASPTVVGLLVMSYAFAQFIFSPILGGLSDRFGRKPILTISQIGTFGSLLLLGFAWALPVIFISRILDGITGANMSTVQSAVTDSTSEKNRTQGLGLVGAAYGLGFVLGPVLGGIALRLGGNNYAAPAFVAAGFAFVSIILTTFMFKETLPTERRGRTESKRVGLHSLYEALVSPKVGHLYGLVFAVQLIFGIFGATFALFTLNRLGFNSVNNSLFFGLFGLILATIQGGFVGRWVQRFGEARVIMAGFILSTIGYALTAFTPQQAVPWYSRSAMLAELSQSGGNLDQLTLLPSELNAGVGAMFFLIFSLFGVAVGYTLLMPSINTVITKQVPAAEVGQALGISAAFVGAGSFVGPVIGGWLFGQFGPIAPFIVNAVLSIAMLGVILFFNHSRSAPQPVPTPIAKPHQQRAPISR